MIERRKAQFVGERDEDEIDLLQILNDVLNVIYKNIRLIIGCVTGGLILGFIAFKILPPLYKARMIADSSILPNTEVINIIDTWNTHLNKGDYTILANKLGLSLEKITNIKRLEAKDTGKTTGTVDDKDVERTSFTIEADVTDIQILDSLQIAIVHSLENNEFIRRRSEVNKQSLIALRNKINSEIEDLNGVKASVKDLLKNGGTASSTFLTDPANVNIQIIALYERVLKLESSLEFIDDIQIIENFSKTSKPDSPRGLICLLTGASAGFFISILLMVLGYLRNKLKEKNTASVYIQ